MKSKRAAIYVRVSTGEQETAMQEEELKDSAERRGWGIKVYRDHGQSGAKEDRPGLSALLADVRRRRIDVVMVWSLDRLARSLKQLLALAEEFQSLGIDLCSHKQAIDTASPAGRLTYQVLGAVAEFEREMLRERVKAGLAQAKRAGKRIGRPPLRRFAADERAEIRALRKKGESVRSLAIRFKTTQYIVSKVTGQVAGAKKHSLLGG
jgi:DNA invertase Pin-like site-specific DNA recombinase